MRTLRQLGWMMVCAALLDSVPARAEDGSASLTAVIGRAQGHGYRLRELYWDSVLRQRWAVLESVLHPELPRLAELTESSPAELAAQVERSTVETAAAVKVIEMVVRAGERVTLWSAEKNIRMQITAVAEQSAPLGGRLQLRATGTGVNGNQGTLVNGIVRGPGSVEME